MKCNVMLYDLMFCFVVVCTYVLIDFFSYVCMYACMHACMYVCMLVMLCYVMFCYAM